MLNILYYFIVKRNVKISKNKMYIVVLFYIKNLIIFFLDFSLRLQKKISVPKHFLIIPTTNLQYNIKEQFVFST